MQKNLPTARKITTPQTQEPSSSNTGNENKSAARWNRAAVSAVTANIMSSKSPEPPKPKPHVTIQAPSNSDSPGRVPSRWKGAFVSATTAKSFTSDYTNLKHIEGAVTPMSDFIRKVKDDDPSLTTIMLDGRKDVPDDEWTQLFDGLEENALLTHLSVANCGLNDDVCVSLALALVENETLTSLILSNNSKLTDSTGKSLLKVLKQSNPVLKKVAIDGTSISRRYLKKIQNVLDDRDETKRLEKVQAARQKKIKELLAFSASDDVSPSSQRLSQRLLEIEQDGEEKDPPKSVRSGSSNSSDKSKDTKSKSTARKKHRQTSMESAAFTSFSSTVSATSNSRKKKGGTNAHLKSSVQASMTARRAMANLGGDMTQVGKSMVQVRETRALRGECPECGIKCFNKTMFKSVPLTVPGKVLEGRCLKCTQ